MFEINPTSCRLSFLSAPDFENPQDVGGVVGDNRYILTVQAADEFGSSHVSVLVKVFDVPEFVGGPPVALDDTTIGFQGNPVTFEVLQNDTDPDGDTLEVTQASLVDMSLGGVTINSDETLTFTPEPLVTGPGTIDYTISDGLGGTDTATLTVLVIPNGVDLARFRPDPALRAVAYLHDILEDTAITYPILAGRFGATIADAVEWLDRAGRPDGRFLYDYDRSSDTS